MCMCVSVLERIDSGAVAVLVTFFSSLFAFLVLGLVELVLLATGVLCLVGVVTVLAGITAMAVLALLKQSAHSQRVELLQARPLAWALVPCGTHERVQFLAVVKFISFEI